MTEGVDRFYDYTSFSNERLQGIFDSWDGMGGYHGLLIKKIASLINEGETILDVGCGMGHLYEATKEKIKYYEGVDHDQRIVEWATAKYRHDPKAVFYKASVYDLGSYHNNDVVTAIGLYSAAPKNP
ncbi:MAG: class I SAM-dependent methyltransferase, partial [Gammaproteobacteria bacterium]|nr:class I SAM-dependent methyltransferase [Gammaproteobacteria bacterium]